MVKVYGSVPPDVQQVNLIALLLQRGQSAADGRMLQRGGNDVPARMAGEPGQPLEREVVGFAGTGGIDDLGGLYAQQSGDLQRGSVDLGSGSGACLMMGVGVADAAPLYGAEPVEYLRVGRGIGGIIQIDHWVSLNLNPFNRYYYSAQGAGLQDAGAKCCRRGIKPEKESNRRKNAKKTGNPLQNGVVSDILYNVRREGESRMHGFTLRSTEAVLSSRMFFLPES